MYKFSNSLSLISLNLYKQIITYNVVLFMSHILFLTNKHALITKLNHPPIPLITLLQNPYSPHYPYNKNSNPAPSKSLPTITLHHPLNQTIPISNLFLRHIFRPHNSFPVLEDDVDSCSFHVGISGRRSRRFGADTASIFILPALYCFRLRIVSWLRC